MLDQARIKLAFKRSQLRSAPARAAAADTAMPEVAGTRHRWLDLDTGVRIHVAESGPAVATTVLALHGWPQHWWMWRSVMTALVGDGLRVVCPDARGFGWSSTPADGDFAKQRLADDALALLDALGLESVHVLGHDWGGWVGFLMVRRAPERVRRLLACSVVAPWQDAGGLNLRDLAFAYQLLVAAPALGPALVRDGRLVAALMRLGTGRGHAWERTALDPFLQTIRTPTAAEASSRLYRSFLTRELPGALHAARVAGTAGQPVSVPVLQLMGTQDLVRSRLPEGTPATPSEWEVELVPGCGHFIVDERPDLVIARARSFFADS